MNWQQQTASPVPHVHLSHQSLYLWARMTAHNVKALTQQCDLTLSMCGTCVLRPVSCVKHLQLLPCYNIRSSKFFAKLNLKLPLVLSLGFLVQCDTMERFHLNAARAEFKVAPRPVASNTLISWQIAPCAEMITGSHTSRPLCFIDLTAGRFWCYIKSRAACAPTIISPYFLRINLN